MFIYGIFSSCIIGMHNKAKQRSYYYGKIHLYACIHIKHIKEFILHKLLIVLIGKIEKSLEVMRRQNNIIDTTVEIQVFVVRCGVHISGNL